LNGFGLEGTLTLINFTVSDDDDLDMINRILSNTGHYYQVNAAQLELVDVNVSTMYRDNLTQKPIKIDNIVDLSDEKEYRLYMRRMARQGFNPNFIHSGNMENSMKASIFNQDAFLFSVRLFTCFNTIVFVGRNFETSERKS
jgi:ubiquinone biosynthesis protein Coq4